MSLLSLILLALHKSQLFIQLVNDFIFLADHLLKLKAALANDFLRAHIGMIVGLG
jgi:hypothetical protein